MARFDWLFAPAGAGPAEPRAELLALEFAVSSYSRWLPVFIMTSPFVAILLLHAPLPLVLAWTVMTVLAYQARYLIGRAFFRCTPAQRLERLNAWRWLTCGAGVLAGVCLGAATWLGMRHGPTEAPLFWTGAMLMHVSIAGMYLWPRQVLPLAVLELGPVVAHWAGRGDSVGATVATLSAGGGLFFILFSVHTQRRELEVVALHLRNEALVGELARRNRELAQACRGKSVLLAAASHDLRQPAYALALVTELIAPRDPLTLRRHLGALRSAVQLLSDVLAQLLDYNRLDLGLYAAQVKPTALAPLVRELAAVHEPTAHHKGVTLQVQAGEIVVHSDMRLLRRSWTICCATPSAARRSAGCASSPACTRGRSSCQ